MKELRQKFDEVVYGEKEKMFIDLPEKNWSLTVMPTRSGLRISTTAENTLAAERAEEIASLVEEILHKLSA
jgi:hypothetical protein